MLFTSESTQALWQWVFCFTSGDKGMISVCTNVYRALFGKWEGNKIQFLKKEA